MKIKLIKILKYTITILYLIITLIYILAVYWHSEYITYALNKLCLPSLLWGSIILALHLLQKYLENRANKNQYNQ